MRSLLLNLLVLAALDYVIVSLMIYRWQEQLIFFPERDPLGTRYAFGLAAEMVAHRAAAPARNAAPLIRVGACQSRGIA